MAQQSKKSKHDKLRHRKNNQEARKEHKLLPSQLQWMNNSKKY